MVARDTVRRVLTARAATGGRLAVADRPRATSAISRSSPDDPRVVRLQNPLAADRSVMRPDAALRSPGGAGDQRPPPGARRPALRDRPGLRGTGRGRPPAGGHAGRARADRAARAARLVRAAGAAPTSSTRRALSRGSSRRSGGARSAIEPDQRRRTSRTVGRRRSWSRATPVGIVGELHPDVQKAFDLPAPVFVAEVSLDAIEALPEPRRPVPAARAAPGRPAGPRGGGVRRRAGRGGGARDRGDPAAVAQARGPLRRLRGRAGRARAEEPRLRAPLPGRRPDAHRRRGQSGARGGRRAAPGRARRRGAGPDGAGRGEAE